MKSILLINVHNSDQIRSTGYFLMPLSLVYLAGVSKHLAKTHILDLNVAKKNFVPTEENKEFSYLATVEKEILRINPDFVGISTLFTAQFGMAIKISELSKKLLPEAVTIVGGMHPSIYYEGIINNCATIDVACIGEGERALQKLLTLDPSEWHTINGIAFKDKINNKVVINLKTEYETNLDNLPPPAYEMFNLKDYQLDSSEWYNPKKVDIGTSVPILTSRSCPFKCAFCGMNLIMGTKFRARSAEEVFKEIEYIHKEYGVNYFNIIDDNFTLNKQRVKKICQLIIDAKMNISYDICNGLMPSTLDDDVIDLLAESGYVYSWLAVESGSEFIRNVVMNKHLSQEKIHSVIKSMRRYPHIHIGAFMLMGMPEETRETLDETIQLLETLDLDDFKMAVATPFPGTKLFEQCLKDGLFLTDNETIQNLWCSPNWYLHILNKEPTLFFKPYKMSVADIQEYIQKFEMIRHKIHLRTCQRGRQTYAVLNSMEEYRRNNPEIAMKLKEEFESELVCA